MSEELPVLCLYVWVDGGQHALDFPGAKGKAWVLTGLPIGFYRKQVRNWNEPCQKLVFLFHWPMNFWGRTKGVYLSQKTERMV